MFPVAYCAHMEAEHIRTGKIGEVAFADHFKWRGFVLIETNYQRGGER